jgi:maleamate amidohydrolase
VDVHPWDDLLTETDKQVIERGGYGKKAGMGSRPALLMIDCQYNHIGADLPILEQIGEHPAGGGASAWEAVRRIEPLLAEFRRQQRPVVYTRYCFSERAAKFDAFASKRGKSIDRFIDGAPGTMIVEPLAPRDDELVIDKVHASAFYATSLLSSLIRAGVDSLVITGVSTSGCVRASAVDGQSNNFKVTVVSDCVADRIVASHQASLLDLWMKYADVDTSDAVMAYLKQLDPTNA